MNRKVFLLISILFTILVFAGTDISEDEYAIPHNLTNNEFYLESLRLTKLAQDTYEYGDYEASAGFADEAIRFALLSDEFVSSELIVEAKRLLDYADNNNISEKFPNNYNEGKNNYEASVESHSNEEWSDSIASAIRSIEILAAFEPGRTIVRSDDGEDEEGLARQYTVRTWMVEKDCLWNIAGYAWVYGDPWKWRVLYEANKSNMPDPNNPDLIEPGMVLIIPR